MSLNRKSINSLAILGLSLLGIYAPFDMLGSFEARKLQLDQSQSPQSGMTRAASGLNDAEWEAFTLVEDQPGCRLENSCNQCKGTCYNDDDCYGILLCQAREGATNPIPGCRLPEGGKAGGICYNPDSEYYPPSPPLENPLITSYDPMCSVDTPCDKCEGMCDLGNDDQCAGEYRCSYFKNKWPQGRKNCNYNGHSSTKKGYCMPAEDYVEYVSYVPTPSADWDASIPDRGELIIVPTCPADGCPVCTAPFGDGNGCTTDSECAADLVCYNHHESDDKRTLQVSGCSSNKIASYGYCYTKDPNYIPPAIPHNDEAPTGPDVPLTNDVSAPEECALYAVDKGKTIDVQFSGVSNFGEKKSLFHDVTYIYVIDASKSTNTYMDNAYCGDANSDMRAKNPIDCEILALEIANNAANAVGNVDLVGLIQFNNKGTTLQGLVEPWAKRSPERRDATVIDVARKISPNEATNFQSGVDQACAMATDAANNNKQTVVIFISDGAPNLGTTSKDTIMNNCGGAVFQTFAITEDADCDIVDVQNLRPGIDEPDTLRQISEFSGGSCAQVPDVGKLPALLVELEKTTWDGVTVKVNDVGDYNAVIEYSKSPPVDAPDSVDFSGTYPLGPGTHKFCLESVSTTSGVAEMTEACRTIVVDGIDATPVSQTVPPGHHAPFTVRFIGGLPGCGRSHDKKIITVTQCGSDVVLTQTMTGADGSVEVFAPPIPGVATACYNVCYTNEEGGKTCTEVTADYMEPAGVNGDPLILGLSGQVFKFDGRSGAWYSAVSTPSFQWNMKINTYETCPDHSNTFVSGVGFTFFNKGKAARSIEVNVVNAYNVDVGCGMSGVHNCLGAGSLELVIDGEKHIVGGDYKNKDGSARITAFNTFYQCSRKWHDFDVRPAKEVEETNLRTSRALANREQSVLDIISGLKSTMIDSEECQSWLHQRATLNDLFQQPGHYSTVIIETEHVTLHLEYKQENERCNAHSIDVWLASVSPELREENWEGIIGETKDLSYVATGKEPEMLDRSKVLKFGKDSDYEVNSPRATTCKGCEKRSKK